MIPKRDERPPGNLQPYIALITAFVEGPMRATEFEQRYLDLYTNDPARWTKKEFSILDQLFGDVDFFVADSDLREPDEGDLDEAELRRCATEALRKLRDLTSP